MPGKNSSFRRRIRHRIQNQTQILLQYQIRSLLIRKSHGIDPLRRRNHPSLPRRIHTHRSAQPLRKHHSHLHPNSHPLLLQLLHRTNPLLRQQHPHPRRRIPRRRTQILPHPHSQPIGPPFLQTQRFRRQPLRRIRPRGTHGHHQRLRLRTRIRRTDQRTVGQPRSPTRGGSRSRGGIDQIFRFSSRDPQRHFRERQSRPGGGGGGQGGEGGGEEEDVVDFHGPSGEIGRLRLEGFGGDGAVHSGGRFGGGECQAGEGSEDAGHFAIEGKDFEYREGGAGEDLSEWGVAGVDFGLWVGDEGIGVGGGGFEVWEDCHHDGCRRGWRAHSGVVVDVFLSLSEGVGGEGVFVYCSASFV
mmetsp:Transcript_31362/g.66285  ORF Transcript_31362/g.66285 Transcript_31362/m.66285 type:complete len:356 (-) Transcript_31362:456-1523(-)